MRQYEIAVRMAVIMANTMVENNEYDFNPADRRILSNLYFQLV